MRRKKKTIVAPFGKAAGREVVAISGTGMNIDIIKLFNVFYAGTVLMKPDQQNVGDGPTWLAICQSI